MGVRWRSLWCARRQTSARWWGRKQRLAYVRTVVICLHRCWSCDSCLHASLIDWSVHCCGTWRTAPERWLCHLNISRGHVGNLQPVNGDPLCPGANLDVKPFVCPCDDGVGTCVGCLKGPLCFTPANVYILSRFQSFGYMETRCLCTMAWALVGLGLRFSI